MNSLVEISQASRGKTDRSSKVIKRTQMTVKQNAAGRL